MTTLSKRLHRYFVPVKRQYRHNMFSGRAKREPLDKDRYSGLRWTAVGDVLAAR